MNVSQRNSEYKWRSMGDSPIREESDRWADSDEDRDNEAPVDLQSLWEFPLSNYWNSSAWKKVWVAGHRKWSIFCLMILISTV